MLIRVKVVLAALMAVLPLTTEASFKSSLRAVNPLSVRPTQAVVGLMWVKAKVEKLRHLSPSQLYEKLRSSPEAAVIGPDGRIWLIDGHHEFRALAEMKVAIAYVEIKADFSGWAWDDFVREMMSRSWCYFGNEEGEMVYSLETMPATVVDLKDDPYRSLASFLRSEGGYTKTKASHAEFKWSNALRFIDPKVVKENFRRALDLAHAFARSSSAAKLPGSSCERSLIFKPTERQYRE